MGLIQVLFADSVLPYIYSELMGRATSSTSYVNTFLMNSENIILYTIWRLCEFTVSKGTNSTCGSVPSIQTFDY